jgi:hypothetical protein
MAGGEIPRVLCQHLEIQALGLVQASAALQRDGLVRQGFSIHVSRIHPAWYPFANSEKQVAEKEWGSKWKAATAAMC